MPANNNPPKINRKPTEGESRNLKQEIFEKNKFKELTASAWHNELEGIGYMIDLPKEEVYFGIPNNIRNQEMVETTFLFKKLYGRELDFRFETDQEKINETKNQIKKRFIYIRYKKNSN